MPPASASAPAPATQSPGASPSATAPPQLVRFRAALLAWYDAERRRLPWREAPSPYRTVVSELMLQQTQVATVLPYFDRFTARFPDFRALAAAPESDVLAAWSGLGYYRRARALKRIAEHVVKRHRGALPADPDLLRVLPGFGDYTTAAVGSIAFGLPLAAVDGNIRRVLARLFALSGPGPAPTAADLVGTDECEANSESPDESTATKKLSEPRRSQAAADLLLDPDRPGDFNQALMELGALVCTPRDPRCLVCPIRAACRARALGAPDAYPAPKPQPRTVAVDETCVAVIRNGRVLVLQRADGDSFAGLWELPRLGTRDFPAHIESQSVRSPDPSSPAQRPVRVIAQRPERPVRVVAESPASYGRTANGRPPAAKTHAAGSLLADDCTATSPPAPDHPAGPLAPAEVLFALTRLRTADFTELGSVRSTFTHHRVTTRLFLAAAPPAGLVRRETHVAHRWIPLDELPDLAASRPQRNLFALLLETNNERR